MRSLFATLVALLLVSSCPTLATDPVQNVEGYFQGVWDVYVLEGSDSKVAFQGTFNSSAGRFDNLVTGPLQLFSTNPSEDTTDGGAGEDDEDKEFSQQTSASSVATSGGSARFVLDIFNRGSFGVKVQIRRAGEEEDEDENEDEEETASDDADDEEAADGARSFKQLKTKKQQQKKESSASASGATRPLLSSEVVFAPHGSVLLGTGHGPTHVVVSSRDVFSLTFPSPAQLRPVDSTTEEQKKPKVVMRTLIFTRHAGSSKGPDQPWYMRMMPFLALIFLSRALSSWLGGRFGQPARPAAAAGRARPAAASPRVQEVS